MEEKAANGQFLAKAASIFKFGLAVWLIFLLSVRESLAEGSHYRPTEEGLG